MKVLVTGGAGFIGANLCAELAQRGADVVAFDDLSSGLEENLETRPNLKLVIGSILDESALRAVMVDVNVVVHLAARPSVPLSILDPVGTHRANVDGTLNVLEAMRASRSAPSIVFASSSSVYGADPALPKHEGLATIPRSPYAASKLASEGMVLGWASSFDIRAIAFRFFNVFGPLQLPGHAYAAVIPAFVYAALRGEPLTVDGDGHQTRDFTFVGTVASVLASAALDQVIHNTPVNLAFGTRTSLLLLIEELESIFGKQLVRNHLQPRHGDVRDSQAANEVLLSLFPDMKPKDLRYGLEATISWMRSRN